MSRCSIRTVDFIFVLVRFGFLFLCFRGTRFARRARASCSAATGGSTSGGNGRRILVLLRHGRGRVVVGCRGSPRGGSTASASATATTAGATGRSGSGFDLSGLTFGDQRAGVDEETVFGNGGLLLPRHFGVVDEVVFFVVFFDFPASFAHGFFVGVVVIVGAGRALLVIHAAHFDVTVAVELGGEIDGHVVGCSAFDLVRGCGDLE